MMMTAVVARKMPRCNDQSRRPVPAPHAWRRIGLEACYGVWKEKACSNPVVAMASGADNEAKAPYVTAVRSPLVVFDSKLPHIINGNLLILALLFGEAARKTAFP